MKSESQSGQGLVAVSGDLDAKASIDSHSFEDCGSSLPEPRYCLRGGTEQGSLESQFPEKPHIESAPQPFRSDAAIMPVDRKSAAALHCIVHKSPHPCPGFIVGKPEIIRIEQGRIHDMKWQLKQPCRM